MTLLYNLLTLLYSVAQICDFKSTLAHCEFTAVFNDLHISAFLMAHFRTVATAAPPVPKHLLLITLWAVACAVNGRQQHLPPFSSLSVLFLLLNISTVSLLPEPMWPRLMGPRSEVISRGWPPFSITWIETRRRWQQEATRVFPSGSSDFWKWSIYPQIKTTRKINMFSWSPQYGISARY